MGKMKQLDILQNSIEEYLKHQMHIETLELLGEVISKRTLEQNIELLLQLLPLSEIEALHEELCGGDYSQADADRDENSYMDRQRG